MSKEGDLSLLRPFTEKEMKYSTFSMDPNKSPCPDGFSMGFHQHFWQVVEDDVMAAVLEFQNPEAVRCFNFTFLVLIPKKETAESVNEY